MVGRALEQQVGGGQESQIARCARWRWLSGKALTFVGSACVGERLGGVPMIRFRCIFDLSLTHQHKYGHTLPNLLLHVFF